MTDLTKALAKSVAAQKAARDAAREQSQQLAAEREQNNGSATPEKPGTP